MKTWRRVLFASLLLVLVFPGISLASTEATLKAAAPSTPTVVTMINTGEGYSPDGRSTNQTNKSEFVDNPVAMAGSTPDSLMGVVGAGNRPWGIGFNPSTNRLYIANSLSNNVSVIDCVSNSTIATVSVGSFPMYIGVNPVSNRVYVSNSHSNDVSVIDGATNTVTATVNVGNNPKVVAVNPSTNLIYVANYSSDNVTVINGSTNNVVTTVGVGSAPFGISVNSVTNRIFVTNWESANLSVIDGATNTVIATVGVGSTPNEVTTNPNTNRIYVDNQGDGNVSVIDGSTSSLIDTVGVGNSPFGIAINPATNRIYVSNPGSSNISVIDGSNDSVVATVNIGTRTAGIVIDTTSNRIYVANPDSNSVSVIQDGNFALTTTVLTSSINPSIVNQPVTFTAAVAGVVSNGGMPTGNVTFKDGAIVLGTAPLNGSGRAVFTWPALSAGIHSITGVYNGDSSFASSTSSYLTLTVNKAASNIFLSSSSNPAAPGQPVTFTAYPYPAPIISVIATIPSDGSENVALNTVVTAIFSESMNSSTISPSSFTLKAGAAAIAGTVNYNESSKMAVFTPYANLSANTTYAATITSGVSNLAGIPLGSNFTLSFTTSATSGETGGGGGGRGGGGGWIVPTGNMTLMDGLTTLATLSLNATGQATSTTSTLSAGSHNITAMYSGDTNYAGNTSAVLAQSIQSGSQSTANISVILQGGSRPETGWMVPLTVRFFTPGADVKTSAPVYICNLTTAKGGSAAVAQATGINPGTYDITAATPTCLVNIKRGILIASPSIDINMGTLLEGDANDSGSINIQDFGLLAAAYGKSSGSSGYDARADFDRSGIINIADFGLLAANYGKNSPVMVS